MNIALFGPPGAGKGTQAQFLKEECQFAYIATGEILRDEIKRNTPLGQQLKKIVDSGNFPSDDIILEVFEESVKKVKGKNMLLDGVPRTLNQAERIDEIFAKIGETLDAVIQLDVEENELVKRLSSRVLCKTCRTPQTFNAMNSHEFVCKQCSGVEYIRRPDDEPEAVKTRLSIYNNQTKPVVEYYKKLGRLYIVDGMKTEKEVKEQIVGVLEKIQVLTKGNGCLYSAQEC